uniref:Uncharacterized protein n=1 Tax=Glossina austeni TaxID=7395 RepID=A0A1A9VCH5_GLOAU
MTVNDNDDDDDDDDDDDGDDDNGDDDANRNKSLACVVFIMKFYWLQMVSIGGGQQVEKWAKGSRSRAHMVRQWKLKVFGNYSDILPQKQYADVIGRKAVDLRIASPRNLYFEDKAYYTIGLILKIDENILMDRFSLLMLGSSQWFYGMVMVFDIKYANSSRIENSYCRKNFFRVQLMTGNSFLFST